MSDDELGNRHVRTFLWGSPFSLSLVGYVSHNVFPSTAGIYPRLVPWELEQERSEIDTTMTVRALSHAYVRLGGGEVAEAFDRVEVYETAETVTIETWLGLPRERGFWRHCRNGQGSVPFHVRVHLDAPLGTGMLVDPACSLDRYAHIGACRYGEKPPYVAPRYPGCVARG